MFFINHRNQGFTLIEFLLAIFISLLLILGVWAVYQERYEISLAQKTTQSVQEIIAATNRIFINSNVFTSRADGLGSLPTFDDVYAAMGRLPEGVVVITASGGGSYSFQNFWGGDYLMSVENSDGEMGTNKDLLTLTLTNLPSRVCINVASILATQSYDVHVNGTLVGLTPPATASATNRNEVRYDQMLPLCSGESNTVAVRSLKEYSYAAMRARPFPSTMTAAETATVLPNYNRLEAAMAARESAQLALP